MSRLGTIRIEVLGSQFMARTRMLKVLRLLIISDLVRQFADYESYSKFIGLFMDHSLARDDAELYELCFETLIE